MNSDSNPHETANPSGDLSDGATIRGLSKGQTVFGRYRLQRILGRGGMGVVWLATDLELDREVALKFLPEMFAYNRGAIEDLKRETRRALEMTHPNIMRIHDFRQDATAAAISMEFVDGDTLANLRADRPQGCFEVEEIRGWVRQLCAALTYAHDEAQMVHRDLKPANLMVTSKGVLKVADFGVSHSLNASVTQLTRQGGVSGTPAYMSPQQMRGEDPSPSDDVYSLGATLYELLTGKPPFTGGDVPYQVREVVPVTVNERRRKFSQPEIPAVWDQAIAACLAKKPQDRPANVRNLTHRLALEMEQGASIPCQRLPQVADNPTTNSPNITETVFHDARSTWFDYQQSKPMAVMLILLVALTGSGIALAWWRHRTTGIINRTDRKTAQFVNSLGMRFVPVPGTELWDAPTGKPLEIGDQLIQVPGTAVLFSIWETRVKDYAAFAAANIGVNDGWKSPIMDHVEVTYSELCPVMNVSWEDAVRFCAWLTEKERREGKIPKKAAYRLPTDTEWSWAVGIGDKEQWVDSRQSDEMLQKLYPWGTTWPPPQRSGNFADRSAKSRFSRLETVEGYEDGYPTTSPTGSFAANTIGIYDLGGNVWEWCEDPSVADGGKRVLRGGAWTTAAGDQLLSSHRRVRSVDARDPGHGFRVVLSGASGE